MALQEQDVRDLEALFGAASTAMELASEVRRRFPGLSLTRCDPSDIGVEEAFRSFPKFDLHLVDGRDHCWQLTGDPACATGIVLVANKVPK
ncbi:hypothetical protein [Telmatospirillum siberiense]|uniref:Uncharacterized protein n=1 Tax=Telmatospirillum siberiense TaxID=382514 RepID=A0A2N3PVY0_9PROT|nr:hypothetical protein [Telmatospirillum siberiense]PKU24564.1 hypothetical protein CWS72_10720 [Telmatospirillum siberiense]